LNIDGTCCEDVTHSTVFVLDESGSVWPSDFAKVIDFIDTIISSMNVDSLNEGTKLGLIGFSDDAYEYFVLDEDWAAF
jgi:hypothetical protein